MYSLLGIPYWLFPIAYFSFPKAALRRTLWKRLPACQSVRTMPSCINRRTLAAETMYFARKTTYSNRKFDIIDTNKWLIQYLLKVIIK